MRKIVVMLILLMAFPAEAEEKLKVVASFSILADITAHITGDVADVHTLVGPNSDVHEYQPTPSDTTLLSHADIIIMNGLGLEGWLDRLIAASDTHAMQVVATKGITPLMIGTIPDPHAWQSLANAHVYVRNIRDALMARDPAHAKLFMVNAGRYDHEIDALEQWVNAQLATLQTKKRQIITSHDAFHYLGNAYGIHIIAPQGFSSEGEPSAAALAKLVDQVRSLGATTVFLENVSDPRLMTMLHEEAGATLGSTLYSDALSAKDGPATDYLTLYRHNMVLLIAAMRGK